MLRSLLLLALVPAFAAAQSAATTPRERTDPNSRRAHQDLLEKARLGAGPDHGVDVYFVGDSITRRWGCTDPMYPDLMESWRENFHGWNAANFAWGGDATQNILWRLDHGELEDLQPDVFVVLAGTNNLWGEVSDAVADDVAAGVRAIVERCLDHAPDARVVLTAIFPRGDRPEVMPAIERINGRLEAYAEEQGDRVRFLNVNDRMLGQNGKLLPGVMRDGLHPTRKGYEIWADGLRPILTEWLGPPADEDHAPPPTGDPSVTPQRLGVG